MCCQDNSPDPTDSPDMWGNTGRSNYEFSYVAHDPTELCDIEGTHLKNDCAEYAPEVGPIE